MKSLGADNSAAQNQEDGLNASQRLFVLTRFSKIDDLLQAIARMAEPNSSPFSRYISDIPPDEAEKLMPVAMEVRGQMISALRDLRIELPAPELSSQWTVQTSLTFIDVALSGMTEKALHGYGSVDRQALRRLESTVGEVKRLVEQARLLVKKTSGRNG